MKNYYRSLSGLHRAFLARAHLDKYGKDDRNDCRPYAKRLGCPLLAIVGGAEPKFFHEYAQELVAAAGASSTYKLVDGGNHFYNRHTAVNYRDH